MEVYANVEKDNKALEQDEGIEFFRREAVYTLGSLQFTFDETQIIYARYGEIEICRFVQEFGHKDNRGVCISLRRKKEEYF